MSEYDAVAAQHRAAARRRGHATLGWVLTGMGGLAFGAGAVVDPAVSALMVAGLVLKVSGGYLIRKAVK